MTVEARLRAMRDLVQRDVGQRGLARDPHDNLLTAYPDDFAAACRSLAETAAPRLGVVTGFHIAAAVPSCHETDGPLGALYLARALTPLGIDVALFADGSSVPALRAGLDACRLTGHVALHSLVSSDHEGLLGPLTHLLALERVGPSHVLGSLAAHPLTTAADLLAFQREVPDSAAGYCRSMRGLDITSYTSPSQLLFERRGPAVVTVGIGDGGNEIGMGKMRWDTIRRNIPNGGLIACRVPTDYLVVAGVSNWGAYALAAGVALLRGQALPRELFDVERERELLRLMVEKGPLVDGVSGKPAVSVDGLSFEEYARPLRELAMI